MGENIFYHLYGGENFSPFIFGTSIIDDDIKDPIRHKFLRIIRESKEGDYSLEFEEFKSKALDYIEGFGESDILKEMEKINKDKRILELEELIRTWDRLASNNPNNIHGLQTSKRQDWVDELMDLKNKEDN